MKRLKKLLSLFIGFAAISMTIGVAYGATSFSNVKEADAAILPSSGKYAYLELNGYGWKDSGAIIKCWDGHNNVTATEVDIYWSGTDTYKVFRATINNDAKDICWKRMDPNKPDDYRPSSESGGQWNYANATYESTNHFKLKSWDSCENAGVICYFDKDTITGGDVTLKYGSTDLYGKQFESKMGDEYGTRVVIKATTNTGYTYKNVTLGGTEKFTDTEMGYHSGWQIGDYFGWFGKIGGTFEINTYTVTYNKGNYGTGTNQTDTKTYGQALTLQDKIFTRSHYEQDGWSTTDGGSITYTLKGTYTANEDITLYPHWNELGKYHVSYNPNGGTGTVKTFDEYTDSSATIKSFDDDQIKFTAPDNQKFKEWNTRDDGKGTSYAAGASISPLSKDTTLTLYAIWVNKPADGFYLRGGSWGWGEDNQKPMTQDPSKEKQQMVKGVALEKNEAVKVVEQKGDELIYYNAQDTSMDGSLYWLEIDRSGTSSYGNVILRGNEYGDRGVFNIYYETDTYKYNFYALRIHYNANGAPGTQSSDYPVAAGYKATVASNGFDYSGHTFQGWNTKPGGNGTTYTAGQVVDFSNRTENLELYAQWAPVDIKYSRVLNGVDTEFHSDGKTSWWGTVDVTNIPYGTQYSTITPSSIYGFGFDGWYSDPDCKRGINSDPVSGQKVYTKYSSLASNRIIYISIPINSFAYSNVTYNGALKLWIEKDENNRTKDVPVQEVGGISSTHLYIASIPEDVDHFYFHSGLLDGEMQTGHTTIELTLEDAGNHNLFLCNEATEGTEYGGRWADCFFQFQISSTNGNWEESTKVAMNEPSSMSSKNDAEALNVNTNGTNYFRAVCVINGTENPIDTVGNDDATKSVVVLDSDEKPTNQFNTVTSVNVYLKNSVIYLVDSSSIAAGGYLYISSSSEPSNIKITVSITTAEGDVTPFSNNSVTNVSGYETTSTLKYDEVDGMVKLPIFNLRGSSVPTSTSVYTVTLGNATFELPQSTKGPVYWINIDTAETPVLYNDAEALGAKAAFDLDKTILGSKDKSVCNCSKEAALTIVGEFDNAKGSTLLTNAEICTYTSKLDSEKAFISIQLPYTQIQRIAAGEKLYGNSFFRSLGLSESEDQTVLIVVIAASATLLATTSALLLLLKKKKKAE